MVLVFAIIAPAHATGDVPDDFVVQRDDGICQISRRERTEHVPSAMRGECVWSGVDAGRLNELLSDFDRYDEFIWVVDTSEVRRTDGDRALVYQLQQMWGMSDREVLLWASSEPTPDGGVQHCWTTAADQPLDPRRGAIRTPVNEGCWTVREDGDGVRVVHEIAVDAGGTPLPAWLLRFVQTRGFARVMDEVRAAASLPVSSAEN